MSNSRQLAITTVAKKFFIALSGLGLVFFIVIHLLGNLALYRSEGSFFNAYTAKLNSFGGFVAIIEILLLAVFLVHSIGAFTTKKKNLGARPIKYLQWRSKGKGTPSNISSRNMAISGMILFLFTLIHVWQFRFGPSIEQGYITTQDGVQIRDLYRLVVEVLQNPLMTCFYMVAMVLLGFHLRHGIWSAFQSLGLTCPRTTQKLRLLGIFISVVLAVGFLFIPVWVYFGVKI
jgi:succinate dehydrogenase / fumarate reductase cytochrome b subunit